MAEYGWGLSEALIRKACRELSEIPNQRKLAIDAVRVEIITRPDIKFLRRDNAFILRFLRARKFDMFESFKLYVRYFAFRQENSNLFCKFHASEPRIKESLFDGLPGVLTKCDHFGRKILVLYSANWDNTRYGLAAIYRAILLTLEKLIDEEATQINGFVIIVDWSQFTFKQSTWLNPKILKLMVEGLQIFMHGINLGILHQHIHKEVLPAELGGVEPPYNNQYWAKQLIGDENFSFGDKHIYWPDHGNFKTRSETFPLDQYSSETKPHEDKRGIHLDEEFFLID